MEKILIDKTAIARRQISEAIRLFFNERDPVVIHTIVASAHQVLVDVGGNKGGVKTVLKNPDTVKADELRQYLKTINYPFNFFRHADRDPEKLINIGPLKELTGEFIMDAVLMLQQITGNLPVEAKVFWMWFVSKHPEGFDNLPDDSEIRKMQQQNLSKWDFPTISKLLIFADVVGDAVA